MDLQDRDFKPNLEEIGDWAGNPLFMEFCGKQAKKGRWRDIRHLPFIFCAFSGDKALARQLVPAGNPRWCCKIR